ncbi:hypothetical protein PMAYCL1PPCAC_18284, partial [Pristionchus mayeri]
IYSRASVTVMQRVAVTLYRMETTGEVVFAEVIDVSENDRTADVISDGSFKSLLLAQSTLENLHKHGFRKPSPVQMRAIPPGMAGLDMLVQAKSGTGKTLVFAILAAENLKLSSKVVQKFVIAPTREIAIQIGETIQKVSTKGTRVAVFTGGTSVLEDKEKLRKGIHIVVGTTGRLCQLVSENVLSLSSLSLFVLDEADKMMSSAFEKDVNFLYSCVPPMRQVAVFSATYPPHLASSLTPFLRSPIHIRLNAHDVQLVGVKQYVSICLGADAVQAAIIAFTSIQFKQAFLFCNKSEECPLIADQLTVKGIEAAPISAQLEQSQREDVIKRLKANKIKVIVSTDLTARGVDADNVDLVINIDTPFDVETYFHRIGRAARYGGQGASLTILHTQRSIARFSYLVRDGGIRAKMVHMDSLIPTLTTDRAFFEASPLFISDKERNGKHEDSKTRDLAGSDELIENLPVENEQMTSDYAVMLDKVYAKVCSPYWKPLQAMILSSTLKNETTEKEIKAGEKKKFKFVPSRAKKSTKYYMKGEMLSIRDAFTIAQWKDYACEKFDMSKEPFIIEDKDVIENVKMDIKWEREKTAEPTLNLSVTRSGIKEYSRKDLIAISKSKPMKVWRVYAESRWNLAVDPFVEDQSMRCSFTDRIRIQRQKDKSERDKVVAERNASRLRLISMGTTVSTFKEWNGSFDEYCKHMKDEMEAFKGRQRRGAVVNRRRGKEEYRRKVEETRSILERIERKYEYTLNVALRGIKEEEVHTEMEIRIEGLTTIDEKDAVINDEEEEGEEEKKQVIYVEGKEEQEGIEDEYGNHGEENAHSMLNPHYSNLYSSHNRNIEFARVFHAYLTSMSTLR